MKINKRLMDCSAKLRKGAALACVMGAVLLSGAASAGQLYFNGFEIDTAGWNGATTRVASGTDGITASSGGYYAQAYNGDFTRWGGYNYGAGNGVPTTFKEYRTSIDIYLNVNGGTPNDTRFDFSSAINGADGFHRRDFAFNAGFYSDTDSGAVTTPSFVISASNNTGRGNSYPQNPGRDPFAVTSTGWYTFEHRFYDNAGVLAVDLMLLDSADAMLHSWTLSNSSDLIGLIGGNRYGYFDGVEFAKLAIDNSELVTPDAANAVPEPASLALFGLGFAGLAMRRRSKRK